MVSQALTLEKSRVGAFFRAWGNLYTFFIRKEAHDRGKEIKGRAGRRKEKGTSSDIKKRTGS